MASATVAPRLSADDSTDDASSLSLGGRLSPDESARPGRLSPDESRSFIPPSEESEPKWLQRSNPFLQNCNQWLKASAPEKLQCHWLGSTNVATWCSCALAWHIPYGFTRSALRPPPTQPGPPSTEPLTTYAISPMLSLKLSSSDRLEPQHLLHFETNNDCVLSITTLLLQPTHFLVPTTYCLLPTTHYPQPTTTRDHH